MAILWQYPRGDRMPEKRNWKGYNDLIRRGEILFGLDSLGRDEEIEKMNGGKSGDYMSI